MGARRAIVLTGMVGLLGLFGGGCGEFPDTTQRDCSHGEVTIEGAFFDPADDALLIVEPELAEQLRPRLLALLRAMADGELDDVPGRDVRTAAVLRVSAIDMQTARRLVDEARCADGAADPKTCPHTALPFARYQWAPYGFADDADAFAERVLCLLGSEPDACASALEPGERTFGSLPLHAWVVSTQDACDPFGSEPDCDLAFSEMIRGWSRSPSLQSLWWPSLIVGAPLDRTTLPAFIDADSRSEYLRRLESDPRMQGDRNADACEGHGDVIAQPARELVRAFLGQGDGVISVCADDYRPALQMADCGGFDGTPASFDPQRVPLLADGLGDCQLDEVLPARGPITHCAQLAEFGRSPEPVRSEDGREVCRVAQLSQADGAAGSGFGWYLVDDRSEAPPAPLPPCASVTRGLGLIPSFAKGTEHIPSSSLRVQCATAAGAPALPRCEDVDGGH